MIQTVEKTKAELSVRKRIQPEISVVLVTYNQAQEIPSVFAGISDTFEKEFNRHYEIVFVDDGSTDDTISQLRRLAQDKENVKVIRMRSHFGEASALEAGLSISSGKIILFLAGRVRIDPSGLLILAEKVKNGDDFVIGWRCPRSDWKLNQMVSKYFNAIVSKLTGLKLHDINSGVFAAKREVLESLDLYGDLNNFIPILVHRLGYKIEEQKVQQQKGYFRKSKYITEYFQRALDILTVIFLTKYSKKPLHFLGLFGILFTISGLAIDIYLFVYRLLGMGPIAGRPLLLLGALLFILGVQMISIGLIGEMIIFTHASEIDEYNIEAIYE